MSKKPVDYYEQRERDAVLRVREILKRLPPACREFIDDIQMNTSPLTRLAYAYDLEVFFQFLTREIAQFADLSPTDFTYQDINKITGRNIREYANYLSLYFNQEEKEVRNKEAGQMRKLASIRSFFKYLFVNEKIDKNTAELIELPKMHEKPILRLEVDEVARILDVAENGEHLSARQQVWHDKTRLRDLAILTLFLGTGIRVSELVGLDTDKIDFSTNSLLVTRKGGKQMTLYFSDEVAQAIKEYLLQRKEIQPAEGDEKALFLSMQKTRIGVRAVENLVKKYARIAAPLKPKLSPHKLRSTYGTALYQETGDIYLVADVLGHSDVNTTKRHYAAMSDERRRMAAKAVVLRNDTAEINDKESDET